MRPADRNPLDLNNFPDDFSSRDGKLALEDTSSSAGGGGGNGRKKKSGGKESSSSKDESGKVYECRFCSLKFGKSQALGGHMNRHRQERETETLNRARQLVFSSDNLIPQPPPPQLGGQPMVHGSYHQVGSMNDPTMQFRSSGYPPRYYSGNTTTTILPPPPPPPSQSYMYPPTSRILSYSTPQNVNDYYVGHALPTTNNHPITPPSQGTNYTCIGAPVLGQGFMHTSVNARGGGGDTADMVVSSGGGGAASGRDMSLQQGMDLSPSNRYQDGF